MSAVGLYLTGIVVLAFGVIGFLRGWYREVVALASLVVGWALVLLAGHLLIAAVDRVYLMAAYVAQGGFDSPDPAALLRELRANPLVAPAHPDPLYAVIFAIAVVVGYWATMRRVPGPDGASAQVLGVAVGLMNGYLIAYALLRYVAPAAVGDGLAATADLVGHYALAVLVVGAVVVAGFFLAALRGRRGPRSAGPARARGRG